VSDSLKDPNKPAGAIVEVRDDGSALRNDGEELQAANSNPWYVLATVFGEQAEGEVQYYYNSKLAAQNRRAWNGWFCAGLSKEERQDRAEKTGLTAGDLKPLTRTERDQITKLFQKRLGKAAKLPSQTETIDFSKTYLPKLLIFEKFVFEKEVTFDSANFSKFANFELANFSETAHFGSTSFIGLAYFRLTSFSGDAYFGSASFNGNAYFGSATFSGHAKFVLASFSEFANFKLTSFSGDAYFDSVSFSGIADFGSASFNGRVDFISASFNGFAYFNSATFREITYFSSVIFKSATRFIDAKFISAVPRFYGAKLNEDTVFTLPDNYRDNWPPLSGQVTVEGQDKPIKVMPAAGQKRAYNRLRLFMNRALQFDEEQFFHRQEMRCKKEMADNRVHWLLYEIYEEVSDYGNSILRPAVWLAVFWIWGAIAKLQAVGGGHYWPDYHSIPHALGWSLSNLFTVFGFWRLYAKEFLELNSWLQLIGSAQTVCGFALLFLLGLGLRNRFRLR